MKRPLLGGILGLVFLATSCANLKEPVPVVSSLGHLSLETRNFQLDSPVIPQDWAWDPGILWSPAEGGRPGTLGPPQALGPLDTGGALARALKRPFPTRGGKLETVPSATAELVVTTFDDTSLGLQIGAFPGAYRVWVNGVQVWSQGVVSTDPEKYQAQGWGTVITVQPRDRVLDIVVQMVSSDPLVRHSEMNRRWVIGPADAMMGAYLEENGWRSLQSSIFVMGILVFLGLGALSSRRRPLIFFVAFLGACLLKLYANVEQPRPLMNLVFPDFPLSWDLLLNHGANLLPFPLLLLFLRKQFPEDFSLRSVLLLFGLTIVLSLWELLPFVFLGFGWVDLYEGVRQTFWALVLNLYVVAVTLYLFERLYQVSVKKRPLGRSLFWGGLLLGLIILLPVPLSYFLSVRYTYFLGWGMFVFLAAVIYELIQIQSREKHSEIAALQQDLNLFRVQAKFLAPEWKRRLGKSGQELFQPGDERVVESSLVQVRSASAPGVWVPLVGRVASQRFGILVEWREGVGLWALDSWSETALAFALEVQKQFARVPDLDYKIVLTRAVVRYVVLDAETHWIPMALDVPGARLDELYRRAVTCDCRVVLDSSLRDGLAIGGWRRHRSLSVQGSESEFYEAEEPALAEGKDRTLGKYEAALELARSGRRTEAIQTMVSVVQENPLDPTAKVLLAEWGDTPHP